MVGSVRVSKKRREARGDGGTHPTREDEKLLRMRGDGKKEVAGDEQKEKNTHTHTLIDI